MTTSESLDAIIDLAQKAKAALLPEVPTTRLVKAGESLVAALAWGVPLETEPGAIFAQSCVFPKGARVAFGAGSGIEGGTGPAVVITPRDGDVMLSGGFLHTQANDVLQFGDNTQTTPEDQPHGLELNGVTITHRGKRGIAINGTGWRLVNCNLEVWSETGQDSQAVYLGNSTGDGYAEGGIWTAGSEIFLSGGDTYGIPGVTPSNVTFKGVTFFRPLTWRTDGIKRKVKNCVEIKNGRQFLFDSCTLDGCWTDGQTGEAMVLTPALDGAVTTTPKPSGIVEDITVRNCDVVNVAAICGMLGRNYSSATATPATRIVFEQNRLHASKLLGGGGYLLKVGASPGWVSFLANEIVTDGSNLIQFYRGVVLEMDGTKAPGANWQGLIFTGNTAALGAYGLNVDGSMNGLHWQTAIDTCDISGNQFTGQALMKKQFPNNVYA